MVLALAFFGGLALLGWVEGVFARQSPATLAALALFAVGFAALTWRVDGALRSAIRRSFPRRSPFPRRRESRLDRKVSLAARE
jgi:hypothetical protein